MATSNKNLYKKQQRQVNTSKKRQAVFITEYVYVKHFEIYQQAAMLYNKINNLYPKKPDLRKTIEFKNWKLIESGMPKIRPHVPRDPTDHFIHDGITMPEEETVEEETVSSTHMSQEEIVSSIPKKSFQLRIPLFHPQHLSELNKHQVSDEVIDEDQQASDEVIDEGQQASDEGQQVGEKRYDVDDIQPSVFGNIPEETVTEIINQLRDDVDLCNFLNDIDAEVGMDDLDIGMEIELDDRLEKELDLLL